MTLRSFAPCAEKFACTVQGRGVGVIPSSDGVNPTFQPIKYVIFYDIVGVRAGQGRSSEMVDENTLFIRSVGS